MFVRSVSWQKDGFSIKWRKRYAFPYQHLEGIGCRRRHVQCNRKRRPPEKTIVFFEFSLCLSRAWLGEMIALIYKLLKTTVFVARSRSSGPDVILRIETVLPPARRWNAWAREGGVRGQRARESQAIRSQVYLPFRSQMALHPVYPESSRHELRHKMQCHRP